MAKQITSHFNVVEFFYSPTACANGVNNVPSVDDIRVVMRNIEYVAVMLELIRKQFGRPIKITSGYRCPALNELVNGSPTSNHLTGLAVDIDCGKALNKKLYLTIHNLKSILPINELINEQDYSWIHVSFNKLSLL